MNKYEDHPIAELFPLVNSQDLKEMAEDIKEGGLREPIVLHEGKILDGRNRYRACLLAEEKPKFIEFKGKDPVSFAVSLNLQRRHLSVGQRAMIAEKLATMKRGSEREDPWGISPNSSIELSCQKKASDKLNVSVNSLKRAKTIRSKGTKEVIEEVESGKKSLNQALKEIKNQEIHQEVDSLGYPIPENLLPVWNRKAEIKDLLLYVSKIKSRVKAAQEEEDPLFAEVNFTGLLTHLENCKISLKRALHYSVCGCGGKKPQSCTLCKGVGLLSQFGWDTFVLPEVKAMRQKSVSK